MKRQEINYLAIISLYFRWYTICCYFEKVKMPFHNIEGFRAKSSKPIDSWNKIYLVDTKI